MIFCIFWPFWTIFDPFLQLFDLLYPFWPVLCPFLTPLYQICPFLPCFDHFRPLFIFNTFCNNFFVPYLSECDKTRNFRRVRVLEFGARGLDDESESGNSYFMVSKTSPSPRIWNCWSRDRVRETCPENLRERYWICDISNAKNLFTTIDYFLFPFVFVVFSFSNVV